MLGRCELGRPAPRATLRRFLTGAGGESSVASATARIATPAPASSPPASSPPFTKVRRLSCLLSSGPMPDMRTCILRTATATTAAAALAAGSPPLALAGPAPQCTPATLDNSAIQAGAVTVSPIPGSRDATPQTQISFRGVPARSLSAVRVTGTVSGAHAGRLEAYSQGDGASFVPSLPFTEGERVTARALLRVAGARRTLSDTFLISRQDPITTTPEHVHPGAASEAQGFRSRPDLHPPVVTVTSHSPAAQAGDVFVAPYAGPGQAGPMILDASGALVWFKPLPDHVSATNFRVQEYGGEPVLTWWEGDISVHGFGLGGDVIANRAYSTVAHVNAGNGLFADLHEFQLTPAGTALITAYDPIFCNLAAVRGPSYGAVVNSVFQEVDVRTGLVRYQWTGLDHVALGDSYEHLTGSLTSPFDFLHINSVNVDTDGGLLVSARNTWTIYDVDEHSGQVLWRLGGRHSTFSEAPGARTAWQHDAREIAPEQISAFDNGSSPTVHAQSRGVVLQLNTQADSATLLSQYTHAPALVAYSQGNVQALANGDWFLGWGQVPDFSELSPEGSPLFDAHFPVHTQSYRSFRFAWTGTPLHRPAFAFQPAAEGGGGTVFASWNGATQVASWRALTGPAPDALQAGAVVPRSGFETAVALPAGTTGPDLAVQALDAVGNVLGTSAIARQVGL